MKLQKLLVIFPVLFVISCLNDYQKRANLDLKVGIWENEWSSWEVVDGLAQIRNDSTEDKIILWAQAPAFKIKLNTTRAAAFQLICRNCLATSRLKFISSSDSTPLINQIPTSFPAEKQWDISNVQADSQYVLEVGEASDGTELAYKVAFFSDIQKEGMAKVEDIFENINNYGEIKFVFSAGDITHRGTPAEIEVFMEKLKTLEVPFYTTSGNHDVGWGEEKAWHRYFGRNSFNFIYRNTAFSFVDSADATVAPKVYSWLDTWLEQSLDRIHIFIAHISPLDPVSSRQGSFSSRLEAHKLIGKLERGKVDLALFGHIHSYYSYSLGNIPAFISGGGGGNEEKLDGISRHYLVLHIDSQQIKGIELVRIPQN